MVDKKENVLVEFDYQNIFLIDPNKTIDSEGNVKERLVNHEELVMFANLECNVLPRTKLSVGLANESTISTISIAKMNFLSPEGQQFLKNGYTNESTFTNLEDIQKKVINAGGTLSNTVTGGYNVRNDDSSSSLLGITSISIKNDTSFLSTVSIELEDIRGRALFELGDQSPYAAFFNLPYPLFQLTLKGYFGKAIKLALMLQSFSARFNTGSGNFNISLKFLTYKYSMMADVTMAALAAVPHMYKTTYKQLPTTNNNGQGDTTTTANNIILERGRQKIIETYGQYKAKGLIPEDFPEITLWEFYKRIDLFLANIESSYSKVKMLGLSDIFTYSDDIKNYQKDVDTAVPSSWANTWLDKKNYVISIDGIKYYTVKKEYDGKPINDVLTPLKAILSKYNDKLNQNTTCGANGKYQFIGSSQPVSINNVSDVKVDDIFVTKKVDVDWCKTYLLQQGAKVCYSNVQTQTKTQDFEIFLRSFTQNQIKLTNQNGQLEPVAYYFHLDEFYRKTNEYQKFNDKTRQQIEEDITLRLADKLKSKESGIGFDPTIRNVLAIIFASGEAFLKLLDEVHFNAWNQRENKSRQGAIFSSNASMDNVKSLDGTSIVYPWPQYVVEKPNTEKNKEIYQITYPGDPDQIKITNGSDYNVWPEIEFVEQFIFGLTQRDKPSETPNDLTNELTQPSRISLNAIEFPITNVVYRNQEQSKFFYEIWERLFVSSFYDGLNREGSKDSQITEVISEAEKENIKIALGKFSPYITNILREFKINKSNFVTLLRHISNEGVGDSWQNFIRNNYVTPYIKNFENNDFGIFDGGILKSTVSQSAAGINNYEKIQKYLDSTKSNKFVFTDRYPFTDLSWLKTNMANGNSIQNTETYNNTSKVLKYNNSNNVICNFGDKITINDNRPITNFNFNDNIVPNVKSYLDLETFYQNRKPNYQLPTEGNLNYHTTGITFTNQTTSIFNTPFFINSIQTGVREYQKSNPYPFVNAAYFFLNSLPLATLREKYKSYESSVATDLDYISATLNKFGAVHKLPYAWILKYGSIWHRYKVWKETGVDIISNSVNDDWVNFDSVKNYDPITNNPTTQYTFTYPDPASTFTTNNATVILEQNVPVNSFTTNTIINVGFYPGLINDFNLFCQGDYIFQNYTSNDIQSAIDKGMALFPGSNNSTGCAILKNKFDTNFSGRTLSLKTWTCFVPQIINSTSGFTGSVYLMPSFGTNINQSYYECFNTQTTGNLKIEVTGNTSMYNGSVRLLWGAPNFGYFNYSGITKPSPEEYLKSIYINKSQQDNFTISNSYTGIDEIFGVFKKEILDSFETEFLKFSKSRYDFSPDDRKNFHNMMRDMLLIDSPFGQSYEQIIADAQNKQLGKLNTLIKSFLEEDVVFKFGNPSNFNRKLFYSVSSSPVVDPYTYLSYSSNSPNALPQVGSPTTLALSKSNYPSAWAALETYVGFSNISSLKYGNNGSYITDFFIDMNIEFTEQNVKVLTPIVKIYVTQKIKNPSLNRTTFISLLDEYLKSNSDYQDIITDSLFTKLNNELPVYSEVGEPVQPTAVDGIQPKVELWETFKAINDKWISGYDFTNKTLFEDVLFLDRASRNVGNQIYVDIIDLKSLLYGIGESKGNMLTYVQSIIVKNNFKVLTMPSYVNFYNVQDASKNPTPKIEGSLEFANTLFGTHLDVDVRESSSKMVCLYGGLPSTQLALPENKEVRRKDDSFDITKSDNPLTENISNKTDWGLSNRVVGFSVDVGVRNQNIFYNVQVDQNNGKATAESLEVLTQVANQAGGKNSYSQNASLWNFYKTRSYTCTVSSFGNMLIQPTMYFNLRHVPMFYGPYMITEVNHSIQPGRFETIFSGVRQPISAYPEIPNLIQSLNKYLLQNIITKLKNDKPADLKNSILKEKAQVTDSILGLPETSNNVEFCQSKLANSYQSYVINPQSNPTKLTLNQAKIIINNISENTKIKTMIFVTMYLNTRTDDSKYFDSFDNNFGLAPLDVVYGGNLSNLFSGKTFNCLKKISDLPYATFKSPDDHITFLEKIWNKVGFTNILPTIDKLSVAKAYVNYYPNIKGDLYDDMKTDESLNLLILKVDNALWEWNNLNS